MSRYVPERIETERLVLERFCRKTVDPLDVYPYYSTRHSDTVREELAHVMLEPHATPKETFDMVVEAEEKWEAGEAALYAITPKAGEAGAGEFAGTAGLYPEWERRTALSAVWLREPFWGRGYSGERTDALLELAFDVLDFELYSAGYLAGNEQSRRAIEKYVERHGGQYDGALRNWVPMGETVRDPHRYTISREQYAEAVE